MTACRERGLDGPLVAGVDVGGTKTSVVVTDGRERILYEHVAPTDQSSLVSQVAGLVDDARRQLRQDIAAVGVAIPGYVDPNDGSVSMAVNLGITHLPLGPMLQAELGVPTFVEHDARAAAIWLSQQAADGPAETPTSVAFLAIRHRHLGRRRPRRGAVSWRQQLRRRSRPRRGRSRRSRLRVRSARLPRDHRCRPGDRSPGR